MPLRMNLPALEIREPEFEAAHSTAHPFSFLVDCPTGDSLDTWRCLPRCTSGRHWPGLHREAGSSGAADSAEMHEGIHAKSSEQYQARLHSYVADKDRSKCYEQRQICLRG